MAKFVENVSFAIGSSIMISDAEFSGESISGIINANSSSIWSIFSIFSPVM